MAKNNISISRQILWSTAGLVFTAMLGSLIFANHLYNKIQEKHLARTFESVAQIIADRSLDFLTAENGELLDQDLNRLDSLPIIDQILIFKLNEFIN